MSKYHKSNAGFTLLEVLLALAIMAMLSLSGYLILDGVLRSNAQQREQSEQLRQIQRAIVLMDKDFGQIIPRNSRDERLIYPMFAISPNWLQTDSGSVSFIRAGWQNPLAQFNRSQLQLVAYRLRKGTLERLYWQYVDSNRQKNQPVSIPLFTKVTSFKVEVFNNNRWQTMWRESRTLPKAIKLTIQFDKTADNATPQSLQRVYYVH